MFCSLFDVVEKDQTSPKSLTALLQKLEQEGLVSVSPDSCFCCCLYLSWSSSRHCRFWWIWCGTEVSSSCFLPVKWPTQAVWSSVKETDLWNMRMKSTFFSFYRATRWLENVLHTSTFYLPWEARLVEERWVFGEMHEVKLMHFLLKPLMQACKHIRECLAKSLQALSLTLNGSCGENKLHCSWGRLYCL